MSETKDAAAPAPQAHSPKKSVALSGVTAGNTALCTVGKTGNDLHYRGYDILDVAESCEFEEIAHLLVHGTLPNLTELAAYKTAARAARPAERAEGRARTDPGVRAPDGRDAHGRVGARHRAAGEGRPQPAGRARHRRPPDGIARLDAAVLVSLSHNGKRIETETDDDSIGGHFLHMLHGKTPSKSWVEAMHTSLILYAEHEFNASTFTGRVIAGTGRHLFGDHRRDRRCAARSMAARTKSRTRSRAATARRTMRKPTSAAASRTRKS